MEVSTTTGPDGVDKLGSCPLVVGFNTKMGSANVDVTDIAEDGVGIVGMGIET